MASSWSAGGLSVPPTSRAGSRVPVHDQHFGRASRELQGRLDGLGQALADVVAADEAVDDHLDRVHLVAGEVDLGPVGQLERDPVDPDPGEALLGQVVEQGAVLPLAPPHHRRHHLETGAVGQLEDPVHDLLRGLARHRPSARRAVGMADAGVEQAQVVVDLRDRAHRRTRVARGRFLVDGDGGRKALDEVDVGLVHLAQELAGVGGERFDIAPLALGVDRVEGQGRLARAREPREDDQPVPGQIEGHVTKVVLPRPANDQAVGHPVRIPVGCDMSARPRRLRWRFSGGATRRSCPPRPNRRPPPRSILRRSP